jgi:RcsF protein
MNKLLIWTALSASLLSACSHYPLETNLDKKNIDEYFKASKVRVLSAQELSQYSYKVLGTVEGFACQEQAKDSAPRHADARTDARNQAADMGGNGIVFSTCIEFEPTATCYASLSCYGKVIQLHQDHPIK